MNRMLEKLTDLNAGLLTFILMALMACRAPGKPTVSLEESCRKASAVVVVESAKEAGTYRILDVLIDGTEGGLKKNEVIDVDLKGIVYEKGKAYILFLEAVAESKRYQAVPQMRTEDGKDARERVAKALAEAKKVK